MAEQPSTTAEEADRLALLRDPPPPPGYVDPLESSPLLHADAVPGPQSHEAAPVDTEPRSLP